MAEDLSANRHTLIQWVKEALTLHMAGRTAEAELLYLKSLALDGKSAGRPAGNGPDSSGSGALRRGSCLYRARAGPGSGHDETWTHRGESLMALGRPQDALGSYDRVMQRRPDALQVRYLRACALNVLGRTSDGARRFEPGAAGQTRSHRGLVVRASILWALGEVDPALESYSRALALDPGQPEALWSRANCRWTRRQDLCGAIEDLERLIAVNSDFPYALGAVLHLRMHAGDWSRSATPARGCRCRGCARVGARLNPLPTRPSAARPPTFWPAPGSMAADKYPPSSLPAALRSA